MSLQSYVFELNSPTIALFFCNKRGVKSGTAGFEKHKK